MDIRDKACTKYLNKACDDHGRYTGGDWINNHYSCKVFQFSIHVLIIVSFIKARQENGYRIIAIAVDPEKEFQDLKVWR